MVSCDFRVEVKLDTTMYSRVVLWGTLLMQNHVHKIKTKCGNESSGYYYSYETAKIDWRALLSKVLVW